MMETHEIANAVVNQLEMEESGMIYLPTLVSMAWLWRGLPSWLADLGRWVSILHRHGRFALTHGAGVGSGPVDGWLQREGEQEAIAKASHMHQKNSFSFANYYLLCLYRLAME